MKSNHLDALLGTSNEAVFLRTVLSEFSETEAVLNLAEFFDLKTVIKIMIVLGGTQVSLPSVGKFLRACRIVTLAGMVTNKEITMADVPKDDQVQVSRCMLGMSDSKKYFDDLIKGLVSKDDSETIWKITQQ